MQYQLFHLKDLEKPGAADLVKLVNSDITETVKSSGHNIFGAFASLFGLASNDIYLVTYGAAPPLQPIFPDNIKVVSNHLFNPTTRPRHHSPCTSPGVYVFRWFSVNADSVDEIVRLSGEAWPAFESSFDTKIQGLFTEAVSQPSEMLLITWYRDLGVWEASRHPPPEARENFLRRHELTLSATPIATLLTGVETGQSPLVSHT